MVLCRYSHRRFFARVQGVRVVKVSEAFFPHTVERVLLTYVFLFDEHFWRAFLCDQGCIELWVVLKGRETLCHVLQLFSVFGYSVAWVLAAIASPFLIVVICPRAGPSHL